ARPSGLLAGAFNPAKSLGMNLSMKLVATDVSPLTLFGRRSEWTHVRCYLVRGRDARAKPWRLPMRLSTAVILPLLNWSRRAHLLFPLIASAALAAEPVMNWPQFRGPGAMGIADNPG